MSSSPVSEHSFRVDAKEYARFCRLRGLFLTDGLEPWRQALEGRKLPEDQILAKLAAAARFVQLFGQPFGPG